MRRIVSFAAALIAVLALQACGGGGSSSTPASGINSSHASVELTAAANLRSSVVEVTLSAQNFEPVFPVVISGPSGAPVPEWITFEPRIEGETLKLKISSKNYLITDGQTYKTTLLLAVNDTKGNRYTKELPVTLTTGGLKFSATEVKLSATSGASSDAVRISFSGDDFGTGKRAAITKWFSSSWLKIQIVPINGYIDFYADTTNQAIGTYTETVIIEVTDDKGKTLIGKLPVTLTVTPPGQTPTTPPIAWNSYNGDLVPDAANALTLASGSSASFTRNGVATGGVTTTSGIATMDTTMNGGAEDMDYRYAMPYSSQYPKKLTVAARVKAESISTALRALTIEANFSESSTTLAADGSRVKLAIWGDEGVSTWQGLTVERCDNRTDPSGVTTWGLCNSAQGAISIRDYHVYQVSITLTEARKGYVNVYVDGASIPVVSYGSATNPLPFRTTVGEGANFIRFGDSNSQVHKSYIDWFVWTLNGAYTPAQLKGKLPANIGEIPATYQ